MSTTVSYKGSTIATVGAQETKTLNTAGKYCEDDITVVDNSLPTAEDKDVNFYDYDGNRLFSYTWEEVNDASFALPTPPDVPELHLAFDGWNWTLGEIRATPGYVEVGACYSPDDCDLALVVEPIVPAHKHAYLRFYCNSGNTVALDWGDGSAVEVYADGTTQTVAEHDWPELRTQYRIKLTRMAGTSIITLGGNANANLAYGVHGNSASQQPVKEIYIGSNAECSQVLANAPVSRIVFGVNAILFKTPAILTRDSSYPKPAICITPHAQNSSYPTITYRWVIIGGAWRNIMNAMNGLRGCTNKKLSIPSETTALGIRVLCELKYVEALHIPSTVTTIASQAFSYLNVAHSPELRDLWFYSASPPSVANSDAFYAWDTIVASCSLFVPFASLALYLTATNYPDPTISLYIGYATYASGASLPTQDSTEAYNVTWYASKADAVNGTNAITEGNGKEIYCTYEEVTTE